MKPYWVRIVCGLFVFFFGVVEPASAAWNNVFQVTCFLRRRRAAARIPIVAQSSPVVVQSSPVVTQSPPVVTQSAPCPQRQCTTRYIQRSYYQPVTTYKTETYYEPVTSYRTSYYYEPVTSYRMSCYYDPCTCSYRQVAVPQTSYRLRSQSCPVQSFVQRCRSVPQTSYRQVNYYVPQTTCCETTTGAPVLGTAPPPTANPNPQISGSSPSTNQNEDPSVQQQSQTRQPQFRKFYSAPETTPSQTQQNSEYRQPFLGNPQPTTKSVTPKSQPRFQGVPLDRFTRNTTENIQGRVVRDNKTPLANTRLVFVNAELRANQHFTTSDSNGNFRLALGSGQWEIYMTQSNGKRVYHSQIDVRNEEQAPFFTLVSHRR
ncbi:MAG: carboxypeptidase-like regulatory domain-containing protein [Gemmataceae bacterium]